MDNPHPDSDMDRSPASNNEEEEMSDPELMPEEEEEISGEEGIPRGINGIQRQNSPPPPPAELLAKLKQQVSYKQEMEATREQLEKAHKEMREMQRQHLEQIAAAAAAAAVHHNSPPPGALMGGGGPPQMPRDPMLSLAASMVPPPVPIFSHPGGAPPPLGQHHALAAAAAAFPTSSALQNSISSASSHSSESSNSSQQTWSFEEQFKQVRQLYELSDDPKRKDFLDDLFSFMQKRGTPINRLPIMAKQVLDLYELYNLVIARGGLVDVINKKLWQEIIKGLHLPSSITSAAFTLRTQYMKYLYPYECEKRSLSSPTELQAAIDGNRREGRRSSYGTYAEMVQRSPGLGAVATSLAQQMSPLSLVTVAGGRPTINGAHHTPQHPLGLGPANGLAPAEFEARMAEYVKLLDKELRRTANTPPTGRQAGMHSPPPSTSPREALNALEMSRLTLWNLYHNSFPEDPRAPVPPPPPQREALNLEVSRQQQAAAAAAAAAAEQARALEAAVKKEVIENGPNPPKRPHMPDDDVLHQHTKLPSPPAGVPGAANIKINSRGDARGENSSLVVSMEINGVMYQGVLFAQVPARNAGRIST